MTKNYNSAVVCCSNGQPAANKINIELLRERLKNIGQNPIFSDYIYAKDGAFSGTAFERADTLMSFYKDNDITEIFDISGGDIANEILPYLDFDIISKSNARFWGYSDLTTIINAIYTKTGKSSVLYQIRNLIKNDYVIQYKNFTDTLLNNKNSLFDFKYDFIQKESMCGIVVGGNIRCFLKLAGTEYFPDLNGKILLLESLGGTVPQMTTYLSQLKQLKAFEKVSGVLLGTFTKMDEEQCSPDITQLIKSFVSSDLPIARTHEIGHGADSKAIVIGKELCLKKSF